MIVLNNTVVDSYQMQHIRIDIQKPQTPLITPFIFCDMDFIKKEIFLL